MNNSKKISILLCVLLCSLFCSISSFCLYASSGTITEVESNNTYSTASKTYNDYDSYGTISSSSDVDWWTITFTEEGFANFWLGKIPSGCNYDLHVYDYTGKKILVESLNTSNSQELTKIHVRAGEIYYIKIVSASGYSTSDKYLLRVKLYDLQDAKVFTSTHSTYNTRSVASKSLPQLWNMGFSGQEYCDNTVQAAYRVFPNTDIYTISAMGTDCGVYLYNGYVLGASTTAEYPSGSLYINSYSSNELSNVKLAVFLSPYAGASYLGANLADTVLSKGAFNCITFTSWIETDDAASWAEKFYYYCQTGQNVGNARTLANKWAENLSTSGISAKSDITMQYCGNSKLYATLLG